MKMVNKKNKIKLVTGKYIYIYASKKWIKIGRKRILPNDRSDGTEKQRISVSVGTKEIDW